MPSAIAGVLRRVIGKGLCGFLSSMCERIMPMMIASWEKLISTAKEAVRSAGSAISLYRHGDMEGTFTVLNF